MRNRGGRHEDESTRSRLLRRSEQRPRAAHIHPAELGRVTRHRHLRREVHHRTHALHCAVHIGAFSYRTEHVLHSVDPRRAALERPHRMPCRRDLRRNRPTQEPARAGDQYPHGCTIRPPDRIRVAHSASRVRLILELWRMSVGSRGTTSTTAIGTERAARTDDASSASASDTRRAGGVVSTTATTCCVPAGPTPTTAERATPGTDSTACSGPTGVNTPDAVVMTCGSLPSTHSRPCSSRCPTSPVRCQRPSPVLRVAASLVSHSLS